jgi:hypothetical protein
MKAGDLVRFRPPYYLREVDGVHAPEGGDWRIGLLVEYRTWEKMATIMYENELLRIQARHVQKFGRRYLE